VGCGNGNVLRVLEEVFADGEVIGIEPFEEGVARARLRVKCPVLIGDTSSLKFDTPFDIVAMFDVLEHIADDMDALQSVGRLLSSDGRIVLTVPCNPRLWSSFDVASHHYRRYTRQTLRTALVDAGYELEFMSPFMAPLLPLMWLKRLGSHKRDMSDRGVIDAEFRITRVANSIAETILLPESVWIGKGWPLPFGTSLLAIARKVACDPTHP